MRTHTHIRGRIRMHSPLAHTEYVILIAFPQQQWLRERASVLRYTNISCLVSVVLQCGGKLRVHSHSLSEGGR